MFAYIKQHVYIYTLISNAHLISLSLTHLPSKINDKFHCESNVLD